MPRLKKFTDVAQMREWRQQYRPSFSSAECLKHEPKVKDRLGTLQVNAYEQDKGSTELFNFFQLEDDAFTSSLHEESVRRQRSENHEQESLSAFAINGDFASVANGYAPKRLATKSWSFSYQ